MNKYHRDFLQNIFIAQALFSFIFVSIILICFFYHFQDKFNEFILFFPSNVCTVQRHAKPQSKIIGNKINN